MFKKGQKLIYLNYGYPLVMGRITSVRPEGVHIKWRDFKYVEYYDFSDDVLNYTFVRPFQKLI